jgi:chromate transporter
MAVLTGVVLLLLPTSGLVQVGCLAAAGLLGLFLLRSESPSDTAPLPLQVARRTGAVALAAFAVLLLLLPLLSGLGTLLELADAMYRAGALVFGGGHVILPLMQAETVPTLVSEDAFLAGYGAAQALPGPLSTFATYLGQVAAGLPGALVSTIAVFLPGFLILLGVLPFWQRVRSDPRVQAALVGVNAAVVGLLGAALIDPIATGAVTSGVDAVFAAALFVALHCVKAPPWSVVLAAVLVSPLLGL